MCCIFIMFRGYIDVSIFLLFSTENVICEFSYAKNLNECNILGIFVELKNYKKACKFFADIFICEKD